MVFSSFWKAIQKLIECFLSYIYCWLLTMGLFYRQKLRRLEVALIEYRESLEEKGVKNLEEIDRKVAMHRKRLQAEYGLSDSGDDGHGTSKFSFLYILTEIGLTKFDISS